MDGARQASRRALLKAAGASVGAAGLAIAATPLAAVAGTDDTNQIDEGAVNISEATTVMKSSSTAGAAFVGQSVTGGRRKNSGSPIPRPAQTASNSSVVYSDMFT